MYSQFKMLSEIDLHWAIITCSGLFAWTRNVQHLVPTLLGVVWLSDFCVCVQFDTEMRRLHESTHVVVQNQDDPDLILSLGICGWRNKLTIAYIEVDQLYVVV